MFILENEFLKATLVSKGAELHQIFDKKRNTEILWDRKNEIWPKSSPILFPIVGELRDNVFRYNDKEYVLPKHGFVRERDFNVLNYSNEEIVFEISSDHSTFSMYPFHFVLRVLYKLIDSQLVCKYEVVNLSEFTMYFSIGGHPAFRLKINQQTHLENYHLIFKDDLILERFFIKNGLIQGDSQRVSLINGRLKLSEDMFNQDAWILKGLNSPTVQLGNNLEKVVLEVDYSEFPFLGLWSKPSAPFLCIEPWYGLNDNYNFQGTIENKEGIINLDPQKSWQQSWKVKV